MESVKINFVRAMIQARQNTCWLAFWGEMGMFPVAISHSAEITGFVRHLHIKHLNECKKSTWGQLWESLVHELNNPASNTWINHTIKWIPEDVNQNIPDINTILVKLNLKQCLNMSSNIV